MDKSCGGEELPTPVIPFGIPVDRIDIQDYQVRKRILTESQKVVDYMSAQQRVPPDLLRAIVDELKRRFVDDPEALRLLKNYRMDDVPQPHEDDAEVAALDAEDAEEEEANLREEGPENDDEANLGGSRKGKREIRFPSPWECWTVTEFITNTGLYQLIALAYRIFVDVATSDTPLGHVVDLERRQARALQGPQRRRATGAAGCYNDRKHRLLAFLFYVAAFEETYQVLIASV